MTVKQLMSAPAATVESTDSLHIADGIMTMGGVRHLPVVSDGRLVGVISQRDVLRASGLLTTMASASRDTTAILRGLRVEDAMSPSVVTIEAEASMQEAAERLLKNRVGCLPVLEDGTLSGIVTTSDLLRAIAPPAGMNDRVGDGAAANTTRPAPSLSDPDVRLGRSSTRPPRPESAGRRFTDG